MSISKERIRKGVKKRKKTLMFVKKRGAEKRKRRKNIESLLNKRKSS